MKYIAYGSNMSVEQMKHRCPDATLIGTGRLLGVQLEFYLHATIEQSDAKDASIPVAVWEISKRDERKLDVYEGVPTYYTKLPCPVFMDTGETLNGMIYIMKLKRDSLPTRDYFEGIRRAYVDLNLSSEIRTALEPALRRAFKRQERLMRTRAKAT